MRAIFLTNLLAATMKAPKALDIHGRQLEFAPNGSTPVDERAFHDAWVRAMVERPALIVDLKLTSAKIGGAQSARELGVEFGNRLEAAGFSPAQILAWLGPDPDAPAAASSPVKAQRDLAEKKALEEAAAEQARRDAEEASVIAAAAEQARKDAEAAARLAAEEQARKDAEALAELEAEEKAKKDAEEAALAATQAATPVATEEAPVATEEALKPAPSRKRGR